MFETLYDIDPPSTKLISSVFHYFGKRTNADNNVGPDMMPMPFTLNSLSGMSIISLSGDGLSF